MNTIVIIACAVSLLICFKWLVVFLYLPLMFFNARMVQRGGLVRNILAAPYILLERMTNSVVAARSVVTKQIPDNEVWGGVPAKFIMTTDEYAKRVYDNAISYPWVDGTTARKKPMSEKELAEKRQDWFFNKKGVSE